MKQKKIAIVNDISGLGRCSTTVALPILSAMGIHCGIVPTAILSNQTEYPEYTMLDFTDYMKNYIDTWKRLHFTFDGLYTGFLGSKEQLDIIEYMIHTFPFEHIIIDPVMGDHGTLYDSYTEDMCEAMRKLIGHATLITPNLTELCILTKTPYHSDCTHEEIQQMCSILCKQHDSIIVVTGIEKDNQIGNAIYQNGELSVYYTPRINPVRPGTGDVFASILSGCSLHNTSIKDAVTTAASFIETCLITSSKMQVPINDGVCFEEHLNLLIPH